MKRSLLVGLLLAVAVMFGGVSGAEATLDCSSGLGKYILNDCVEHPKEKNKMEVGVGVDVPLYKSEKLIVDQETKIDLNQGDFGDFKKSNIGTYTVFKPQLDEGILQTAFHKIKSLFNRGE